MSVRSSSYSRIRIPQIPIRNDGSVLAELNIGVIQDYAMFMALSSNDQGHDGEVAKSNLKEIKTKFIILQVLSIQPKYPKT